MKITTWNVNGFRAVLNKGNFGWVADESPDILCLQEVKAKEEQIEDSLRRMDGMISIVNKRSPRLRMVRVAMIAGTLQPKPITIGINDRP